MCARCVVLQGVILAQRLEIAHLKQVIERLKIIIARAREAAAVYAGEADKVMSQHQPRPVWAYAKAVKAVAQNMYNLLG